MSLKNRLKKTLSVLFRIVVALFALVGLATTILAGSLFRHPTQLLTAASAYELIRSSYYEKVDQGRLVEGIAFGLTASLGDPYSEYYTQEQFSAFTSHITGVYAGIGVLLGMDKETGLVKGIKVFSGSPAAKAGILPGDLIVEVDGKNTEGFTVEAVANLAKGTAGTTVKVVVFRNGAPLTFEILRAEIKAPSVSGKLLSDRITYYIEISSFGDTTANELKNLLQSLGDKPNRIVLDLRNNGGGLVDQTIEVAKYFLNGGVVLYESGRDKTKLQTFEIGNDGYLGVPVVVLVNGNTASSAEILAGALQDHKAAVLVGEQTFGKAVVQTVFPMPSGGALKLTTQRYLTPLKRDINRVGLTPDIEVQMGPEVLGTIDYGMLPDEAHDLQLRKALEILDQR